MLLPSCVAGSSDATLIGARVPHATPGSGKRRIKSTKVYQGPTQRMPARLSELARETHPTAVENCGFHTDQHDDRFMTWHQLMYSCMHIHIEVLQLLSRN